MGIPQRGRFSKLQVKFLVILGFAAALRELSMTMLNPFINIYGETLKWSTPLLCGIALGIYGLTNAVFQLPYGRWSDFSGRKPVILTGLAQLAAGLVLAFFANDIFTLILARALQGSGALMAIAYSWIGDGIEDDSQKSKAMGIVGVMVAVGAVAAFIAGPLLYRIISVKDMFLGCAILIFAAIVLILLFVPETKSDKETLSPAAASPITKILMNRQVQLLSLSGFSINYLNAELFLVVPPRLNQDIGAANMWIVFLPAILLGMVAMRITTTLADRGYYVQVSSAAFTAALFGWILLAVNGLVFTILGTTLSLAGFMCLTAGIPSEINKLMSKDKRGTANGVMQTFAFVGFFLGPTIAGLLIGYQMERALFGLSLLIAAIGVMSSFLISVYRQA